MADDGVWTTNAMIAAKAGANVNATAITVAETDKHVLQIENFINCKVQYNFSDNYAGLNVDVKSMIELASSCLCAILAIQYDVNGYGRASAATMMNALSWLANDTIKQLQNMDVKQFMIKA